MAFKDNVYRDIYDHFGTIMGDMACVMRERYDIPIDWITMHLDDGTTVSDDGIMGIVQHGPTFCVRLKDLAVETGIMYVSVRKIVDFARSLDDDFYMPLSVGGMAHIVELMDLCDMFPYKEYKTTTKSIMDAIKYDYEHYHRISWITEALRWLVHDKPILNVPVTMEWLAPNMEYPLEYLKGSYAVDSVMTMEEYSEHFDRMAGWVKKNITAIGFTRAFLDSLFFERSASYDKSRTVNSSNILQWDHILDMIPTIPPTLIRVINELFTGNHDDEDIMGFFIYSDMTSASKSGKKTYTYSHRAMEQSSTATIQYATAALSSSDSMIRWLTWMLFQEHLRMNANFLAVDEYMRTKIIMDDVHLNKCPKEIIQWLDDGTVPNVIHYDAHATLSLRKKDSNALLGMLKEITRLYEGN